MFVRFRVGIGSGLGQDIGHMARRRRVGVDGGLYHLITCGVDRPDIFHDELDHAKFLAFMAVQKGSLADNCEPRQRICR